MVGSSGGLPEHSSATRPGGRAGLDGSRPAEPAETLSERTAQAEVARLRSGLLAGRGPGASQQETARYMHDRPTVGAVPTVIERELVQVRSGLARGDADAAALVVRRARAQLSEVLDTLAGELVPSRLAHRTMEVARARCALLLGAPPPSGFSSATPDARPGSARSGKASRTREEWWWRVAVRAAAAGAATSLGLVSLACTRGRRRNRTAPRSPRRPAR